MFKKIILVKEQLPQRCDICHQADLFNSKLNYCERCKDVKDIVKEESRCNLSHNQKKNIDFQRTQRTLLGIAIGSICSALIWKFILWRFFDDLTALFYVDNINFFKKENLSLHIVLFAFFAVISVSVGLAIRFLNKPSINSLSTTVFILLFVHVFWTTADTILYVRKITNILFEIASILAGATFGLAVPFLTSKYIKSQSGVKK